MMIRLAFAARYGRFSRSRESVPAILQTGANGPGNGYRLSRIRVPVLLYPGTEAYVTF